MRKKKEEKSLRILLQNLMHMLKKWLRPQKVSKIDICNQILQKQFLLDLEENAQWWVQCHYPKLLAEALCLAKDFDSAQGESVQARGLKGGPNTIWHETKRKETQEAHQVQSASVICFWCGKAGHMARECNSTPWSVP